VTPPRTDVGATGAARVRLVVREGCHLCADAREVVGRVCTDLGERYDEADCDADPRLARYSDMVPVVLVDGEQVDYWRVDPERLRSALAGSGRRRWWR
jgi:predicted thioredoxin/glutaredoxin